MILMVDDIEQQNEGKSHFLFFFWVGVVDCSYIMMNSHLVIDIKCHKICERCPKLKAQDLQV